ncbi:MAG: type I methionyl aminopeptidase [Candidatus Symbiodolus clandestinus]
MDIIINSADAIARMRVAGRLAAEVLEMIAPYVVPGVTTEALDQRCHQYIIQQHARPACLGYRGFPKSVCISVNEVVCHGIPGERLLKVGDIVNIDVTVIKEGFHGDTSKMFFVGSPSVLAQRLCRVTQQSLYQALTMVRPFVRLKEIGRTIQRIVEAEGFSVVRDYCGHGIGQAFHQAPQVLHFLADDKGITLQEGMTFTIEPMINAGKAATKTMKDGWTAKTKDHSLSAQYEHTVLVTATGCEVLTWRAEESIPQIFSHP